jgi:DNA-binding MarR family transcriptional regulator
VIKTLMRIAGADPLDPITHLFQSPHDAPENRVWQILFLFLQPLWRPAIRIFLASCSHGRLLSPNSDSTTQDKPPAFGYTLPVKPFDQSMKSSSRPGPMRPPASADSCAALLLETAPRVLRAVRMAIAEAEAPPLTIPQFRALHFIQDHPGVSLSTTADFLGLTLPSTSKLVDQLVRRGMLVRVDASDDRRRMILRITAKGDALLISAQSLVRQHLAGMLNRLTSAELAALHNTLGLLQESFPSHRGPVLALDGREDTGKKNLARDGKPATVKTLSAADVRR